MTLQIHIFYKKILVSTIFLLFGIGTIFAQYTEIDSNPCLECSCDPSYCFDEEEIILEKNNDKSSEEEEDICFCSNATSEELRLANYARTVEAKIQGYQDWENRQFDIVKDEIEERLGQEFSSFNDARNSFYEFLEMNYVKKSIPSLKVKYKNQVSSKSSSRIRYSKNLKLLYMREKEIISGNISQSSLGILKYENTSLSDIKMHNVITSLIEHEKSLFGNADWTLSDAHNTYDHLIEIEGDLTSDTYNSVLNGLSEKQIAHFNSISERLDQLSLIVLYLNEKELPIPYKKGGVPSVRESDEVLKAYAEGNGWSVIRKYPLIETFVSSAPQHAETYAYKYRGGNTSPFHPNHYYYSDPVDDIEEQEANEYYDSIFNAHYEKQRQAVLADAMDAISDEEIIKDVCEQIGIGSDDCRTFTVYLDEDGDEWYSEMKTDVYKDQNGVNTYFVLNNGSIEVLNGNWNTTSNKGEDCDDTKYDLSNSCLEGCPVKEDDDIFSEFTDFGTKVLESYIKYEDIIDASLSTAGGVITTAAGITLAGVPGAQGLAVVAITYGTAQTGFGLAKLSDAIKKEMDSNYPTNPRLNNANNFGQLVGNDLEEKGVPCAGEVGYYMGESIEFVSNLASGITKLNKAKSLLQTSMAGLKISKAVSHGINTSVNAAFDIFVADANNKIANITNLTSKVDFIETEIGIEVKVFFEASNGDGDFIKEVKTFVIKADAIIEEGN